MEAEAGELGSVPGFSTHSRCALGHVPCAHWTFWVAVRGEAYSGTVLPCRVGEGMLKGWEEVRSRPGVRDGVRAGFQSGKHVEHAELGKRGDHHYTQLPTR